MNWNEDFEADMPPVRRPKPRKDAKPAAEVPPVNTAGTPKPRAPRVPKPKTPREAPPQKPKTLTGAAARQCDDILETTKTFFGYSEVRDWRGLIYIGIDTGKDGAIGLLYPEKPEITTASQLPTMDIRRGGKTKKGNARFKTLYDEGMLWEVVQVWLPFRSRIVVAIEETQPRETDGGRTGHAMGYGLGMWPLFLRSHGFTVEMVLPAVWKVKMGLAGKDKEWSRLMAQRLWPAAPLFRKKDEARAEALLIAECIRRRRETTK